MPDIVNAYVYWSAKDRSIVEGFTKPHLVLSQVRTNLLRKKSLKWAIAVLKLKFLEI